MRNDSVTLNRALKTLRDKHPKLLFVEFCETDYYGHHGKWKEYLNAAHQNDQFIRQLWECCQQAPFYKGISWAAKGAAEPLVRSWNDIAVEVLDRYQHLIDRQQNRLAI